MHVVTNTIRRGERTYTATLLRRSFREDGKVKKETLANLSHLPAEAIDAIRRVLAGETLMGAEDAFTIERSLPAGHVNAALSMARRLEFAKLLDRSPSRERDLCLAMILGRVICPGSRLGTVRTLGQSTLASELGVEGVDEDDLYAAMDWLLERQERIEDRLAARHLADGEMVLYDVSSSYFEGRTCALARLGYSRDGKLGLPQIIYGLLCDMDGRPVAVEVFSGELHDDATVSSQITKLKGPLPARACDRGDGPWDGHEDEHRAALPGRRDRLDHRAQSPDDQETRPHWRVPTVTVRPAQPR